MAEQSAVADFASFMDCIKASRKLSTVVELVVGLVVTDACVDKVGFDLL